MAAALNPKLDAMHHEEPDGPTECVAVMSQDFKSLLWETIANVPSYGEWLAETDHRSAYRHHKLVLQILQSGGRSGPLGAEVSAPRAGAGGVARDVPGRDLRHAAPRSGRRHRVLLQPDRRRSAGASPTPITPPISPATGLTSSSNRLLGSTRSGLRIRRTRSSMCTTPIWYATRSRPSARSTRAPGERSIRLLRQRCRTTSPAHPQGEFGRHRYRLEDLGLDGGELAYRFADYVSHHRRCAGISAWVMGVSGRSSAAAASRRTPSNPPSRPRSAGAGHGRRRCAPSRPRRCRARRG